MGSVMALAIQILEVVFLTNVDPSSEIDGAPNPSSSMSAEPPGAMKVVRN